MSDNKDFTELFFSWAKCQELNSNDIANELGKAQAVVSNWRSRGVPKGHQYACQAYMDKVAWRAIIGTNAID